MIYVLILFTHVGLMGSGNSNALTKSEKPSRKPQKVPRSPYRIQPKGVGA